MIYTVGLRLKYERAFAAGKVVKRGTGSDYDGGFVFPTAAAAGRFLEERGLSATHMVVGVRADWDRDTAVEAGKEYRRLARDAEVIRL